MAEICEFVVKLPGLYSNVASTAPLNFTKTWDDYKTGFGDLNSEFWLGNDNLHRLTARGSHSLRYVFTYIIQPQVVNGTYGSFAIAHESDGYRLHVADFQGGNGGNAFDYTTTPAHTHNGHQFSTLDRDNDGALHSCAEMYGGGFWYNNCWRISPNGFYKLTTNCPDGDCIGLDTMGSATVMATELLLRIN